MALQAPCHVERLLLVDFDHLIDAAVAAYAAYTRCYMSTVIKINVVRKLVNFDPGNRLARFLRAALRLEARTFVLNLGMAIHANLGSRNGGVRRAVNRRMAIEAVQSQLPDVQLVTIRYRLYRLISGVNYRWITVVSKRGDARH